MSIAELTPQQWDSLGRFQRSLSVLDVEWELRVLYYDRPKPSVYVTLSMPLSRDFQALDTIVERAFEGADVPGYEYDGTSVQMEPNGDTRERNLVFYPVAA